MWTTQECWELFWRNPESNIPRHVRQFTHQRWEVRRTAGHYKRSKDELISDLLLLTPTQGCVSVGWPARTYLHLLCADTGCSLKELHGAMDDRDGWREREGNPSCQCTLMIYILQHFGHLEKYIYIYIYIYILVEMIDYKEHYTLNLVISMFTSTPKPFTHPVDWGYRIDWLHLCRGVRSFLIGPTRNVWGRTPGDLQHITSALTSSWQVVRKVRYELVMSNPIT